MSAKTIAKPLKILHFADAHIDMANFGRHDAVTGLPVRVMDFLKSLDEIVDTAINEKVDLVLFAGDAYKDRNPAPTFQREWGRRIIRLSKAHIPTLLLIGNHDLSPSLGRAHALEEFNTLEVPYVKVLAEPALYGPKDLWDLPLQVIALPWIARSQMMARGNFEGTDVVQIYAHLESLLSELVENRLQEADANLPIILAAHASVQGASFGGERSVMLGSDLVLSGSLVKDKRLDYVALGHIHKHQDLNEGSQPPVVYPGSIERVDFGEAKDDKFFVVVHVAKGASQVEWRQLKDIRPFIDPPPVKLEVGDDVNAKLLSKLPKPEKMKDAIMRLTIEYPRQLEPLIDEASLRAAAATAFEFHLVKRPQAEARVRIPLDSRVGELSAGDLLDIFWKENHLEAAERKNLAEMARQIIEDSQHED
jgi:exonuclease SbcD